MTYRRGRRKNFRRGLREKGPLNLKEHPPKKREGEIMETATKSVITMAPTTPLYDAIQIMAKEGFRRIPITKPGTKTLHGIVTATDVINYLGGGKKFQIIQRKYAGNFFKAINEPVKSIMTYNVVSVPMSGRISEAIELMKKHNVGGLPVVDGENRVHGIITERDIANLFIGRFSKVKVAELMSKHAVTVKPKTSIFQAAETMTKRGFRRLPIVSDNKIVGIVTVMDILRFFGSGEVFKHLRSGTITQVLQTSIMEIAVKDVTTVEPDADVGEAARIMQEKNIGALPVIKEEKLIGMFTERDFFKLIA
ncbi:MAG: CBS domain-containing protein [Thermoproteota archaeon]|nr:CBS domain-containing protein [Thermoproteota archaeon]